jgi:glycosyltransferase involved in cell wall biosynthesis
MPDKKLKIIGAWNYESTLKELVKSENIEFTGPQYWTDLEDLVNHSRGLIFPWEEDFWITPVEAMSASKPVFAYRAWGLLETNIEWITWEFFDDKNWVDFIEKFEKFEKNILSWKYDKEKIRENALRFSYESFEKNLKNIINNW